MCVGTTYDDIILRLYSVLAYVPARSHVTDFCHLHFVLEDVDVNGSLVTHKEGGKNIGQEIILDGVHHNASITSVDAVVRLLQ